MINIDVNYVIYKNSTSLEDWCTHFFLFTLAAESSVVLYIFVLLLHRRLTF